MHGPGSITGLLPGACDSTGGSYQLGDAGVAKFPKLEARAKTNDCRRYTLGIWSLSRGCHQAQQVGKQKQSCYCSGVILCCIPDAKSAGSRKSPEGISLCFLGVFLCASSRVVAWLPQKRFLLRL